MRLRPTRLPMGRLDFSLPRETACAKLDVYKGSGIFLDDGNKTAMECFIPRNLPVFCLRGFESNLNFKGIVPGSGPEPENKYPGLPPLKEYFAKSGFPDFQRFSNGWFQEIPGQYTLCVMWKFVENENSSDIYLCAEYGASLEEAKIKQTKFCKIWNIQH